MKIYFKTNLDWYSGASFPVLENIVPRKGEIVSVHQQSLSFCEHNKIPSQLEVVNVTYYYDRVICELWYRDIDIKWAELSENGLKHLYKN